jgi:purine nucleoside phosphorylase
MTSSTTSSLGQARLGVLGGSGLYAMEGLEKLREIELETPYGSPSDSLRLGSIGDLEVVFLARHGRHHSLTLAAEMRHAPVFRHQRRHGREKKRERLAETVVTP